MTQKHPWDPVQAAHCAAYLEEAIERLRSLHAHPHAFWQHARTVAEAFRTVTPLRGVDRERLWQQYRQACQAMKHRQAQPWRER